MPQVPRINAGGSTPRLGSVGRLRVNAPVEAFGGGAAAQGLAQLGKGVAAVGQGIQDIQQKNDNADILSAKTAASNVWNRAAIEAKRATSTEEVKKIFEKARKDAETAAQGRLRSGSAQAQFATWHEGEIGRRSNQELSINYAVNDRITKAKTQVTRDELRTSAVDENSLANNKHKLGQLWSQQADLTDEEVEIGLKEDLRAADMDFAGKLYNSINVNEDSSDEIQSKLNTYAAFVKNANSLTETDKAKLNKEIEKADRAVKLKKEDEFVDALVSTSGAPENEVDVQSEAGQLEEYERIGTLVDLDGGFKTEEERDRVKSKAMSILSRRFDLINKQRRQMVEEYLRDPQSDIQEFIKMESISPGERAAGLKVLSDRQKPLIVDLARKTINDDIERFDPINYSSDDLIAITTKLEVLKPAERKVYKDILDGKIDSVKKKYNDVYSEYERILNQRFKLTGKDMDKDVTVYLHGKKVKLTPEQRVQEKLNMMNKLRDIGDKRLDNEQMFQIESQKLMDTEREISADELADQIAIGLAIGKAL